MAFYPTKNSTALVGDQIIQDVEVYIRKYEYVGSGVASIATNDITLTPAVSPAWTIDALISEGASSCNNLVVKGDASVVLEGKVKDNTATAITFDATAMVDVSDGTAGAATDFTAASTYDFYVLTPSEVSIYGDYFGWTGEVTINSEEEYAEFKQGVPRVLKNQCLLERSINITGTNFNPANEDVMAAIFNMTERGLQTGQAEYQSGFDPGARADYRMTLVGQTGCGSDGQVMVFDFFKGKIRQEGGINMSEEGFKAYGWNFVVESDNLRDAGYDAYRWVKVDAT